MSTLVMLRVKTPGPEALDLLARIEAALHVGAQPQTAGFVPIAVDESDPERAREAVVRILDDSGVEWRTHLEFRR
ncbi:MAG: hypothetical protein NVSMB25_01100 [Thermoleophilaceae bacterium]